jgi:hypothetical protein
MMRALAAVLFLVVLFLTAKNARLADRERILEEKLALAEARRNPLAKVAVDLEPAPLAQPPASAPRPEPRSEPPLPPAQGGAARATTDILRQPPVGAQESAVTLNNHGGAAFFALQDGALSFSLAPNDENLGLSASQKQAIDQLRTLRDARTQAYRDEIARIESQTDASIRQLLDPEQLAKYDTRGNGTAQVQVSVAQEDPALPSGLSPGYLGVSGEDVQGGGVRLGSILENTVASAAGLKPGDVILEVNGERIPNYAALAAKVRSSGEGSPALLRIQRGGSEFTQGLQLGGRPR